MQYRIDGLSIHAEDRGAGETALVFLHYWGGTHRTWNQVIIGLSASYRCVAYDSRGWGGSEGPMDGYTMDELADEASGVILALGLKNFVLVGHSMGGKVAQLLASRRPEGLRGLILVAPATPGPTHFPEEALQQQLHAYDNRETVMQTINFLCARTPSDELVEQIVTDSLSGTPAAKQAWPTIGIVEDISEVVKRIDVPTLVIAGGRDNLDSVEQHKREVLSRIPNSELAIVAESGHLLPIDAPLEVASLIRRFLVEQL